MLSYHIKIYGVEYKSIRSAYASLDIPCRYSSFRQAIKEIPLDEIDSRIDEVIEKFYGKYNSKRPEVLGVRFESVADACESFGVSRNVVAKRKERGYTVTEQYLGKLKKGNPRILNKDTVAVLLKNNLLHGVKYSDSVEFFDGDVKCTLDRETKELVKRFLEYCKEGYGQYQAYYKVFEE